MNTNKRIFSLLIALLVLVACFAGCQTDDTVSGGDDSPKEFVDYVAKTTLNMQTGTKKQEVTVENVVDGDTTHFYVPESISPDGVLKARYMCVNTPESTGKIEEWGKKASSFTKEKLSNAKSIIVESNDDKWNVDSTGGRHLVWVWYQPQDSDTYRCLNLELIQNGLSISCGTVADLYGDVASRAFQQAKAHKKNVFSGEKDPDFYYGDAYEISLMGLRTNIELYNNAKVAFEGVVTHNNNNSVYVESYDPVTDMYYGISVYYGYETGELLNILKVGNMVRVVGTVTYYETGGTWQVSGLSYREFKPQDPGNTIKLSEGHTAANTETDPSVFNNGKVSIEVMSDLTENAETVTKEFDYAFLAMDTTVSMKNLTVINAYTTQNGGNSDGAMTLTCAVGNQTVDVRTIVLYDEDGNMITSDYYLEKTIDVVGLVDYYSGDYQIKVLSADDIIVH